MKEEILVNKIRTPDGTIIRSFHRHDCVSHDDANGTTYVVDGGTDYLRRGGKDDYTDLSVSTSSPHEYVRERFEWTTFGISGKEPAKYIKIRHLQYTHIYNIMANEALTPNLRQIFVNELDYRARHGVA